MTGGASMPSCRPGAARDVPFRGVATLARAAVASAAVVLPLAAQDASPPDRARYAAAWDTTVAAIARSWVDTAFLSAHWMPAARADRAGAVSATDDDAFRAALQGLIGRIPASHFYVLPSSAFDAPDGADGAERTGRPGLRLRLGRRDGRVVLLAASVDTTGAAHHAGVRSGDEIVSIDEHAISDRLARLPADSVAGSAVARSTLTSAANALLSGGAGATRTVRVVRAGRTDDTLSLVVTLAPETRPLLGFGNLPPIPVAVRHSVVPIGDRMDDASGDPARGRAAVIAFDAFIPALMPALDNALFAARGCDALILDLRGNPGGLIGMIGGIAGHLLPTPDTLAVLTTRESVLRLVANPRTVRRDGTAVPTFGGPVLVLQDEASASASEILAGALQGLGRARLVGATSAGQALPAQLRRLATGDVLIHATADLAGPRGARAEGAGLVPDIPVTLTPSRLARGDDPILAAALAALRGTVAPRADAATCTAASR